MLRELNHTQEAGMSGKLATGIPGFDSLLGGGLPKRRLYLIEGEPGTGKTTFALHFLLEGLHHGEEGMYVTLSETKAELEGVAASHGWSIEPLHIFEVQVSEDELKAEEQYSAFHPSEIELGETVSTLLSEVERLRPVRVVVDSMSEMRLLARDSLRYRRQMLALKQFFVTRGCTVLFLDDATPRPGEHQIHTLAHGVIKLERMTPAYGRERRRLQIAKLRGVAFHGGYHDFALAPGGITVFPCLVAAEHSREFKREQVKSLLPTLDELLGGGPNRGTSCLVTGPAGVGKSTVALHYALAAAARGEHSAVYSFDEGVETIFERCAALNMNVREQVDAGVLAVEQIDPGALSPGEFIHRVRLAVERDNAKVVIIDSLDGYLNAMPGEQYLIIQMHELLSYLAKLGVLTIVVVAHHGLVSTHPNGSPVDLSYLADTVVLLRYFEHAGCVRKAVAALKKRSGRHENSIRELKINSGGLVVGEPLMDFNGILSGAPTYLGSPAPLLDPGDDRRVA